MAGSDEEPAVSGIGSVRNARSNYVYYLAATGLGVLALISIDVFDTGEPYFFDGELNEYVWFMAVGGIVCLVSLVFFVDRVVRAYADMKAANEQTETHFRVQIWQLLDLLVLHGDHLNRRLDSGCRDPNPELRDAIEYLAWVAITAWFVIRCVKGLGYLGRQEPYPNPATWLW